MLAFALQAMMLLLLQSEGGDTIFKKRNTRPNPSKIGKKISKRLMFVFGFSWSQHDLNDLDTKIVDNTGLSK